VEPNYGLSGKLAEESNTVRGVVLLHNEPPEARKPSLRWRLYTFKNGACALQLALAASSLSVAHPLSAFILSRAMCLRVGLTPEPDRA
jgi:hypothetical protein